MHEGIREWLLEEENPSIRYRTLTEIFGVPKADAAETYDRIWESRAVQRMLARQSDGGVWEHTRKAYGIHTSTRYFTGRDVFFDSQTRQNLVLDARPGWRSIDSFFPPEPMRIGLPHIVAALSMLGAGSHAGLTRAWAYLSERRDTEGRLLLEGTLTKQPCSFGKVGEPNKWATLYAEIAEMQRA